MTTAPRPPTRGPYAKGVARRREIVDAALDVLAVSSFQNSSLDEIARRVGITRQGLLHYFGSKDNLIIAVLQERDTRDIAAGLGAAHSSQSAGDAMQRSVDRTQASPGLARLYTAFAAAATDPAHPAHEFFRHRYDDIRETTRRGIEAAISERRVDPAVDAGTASQQIVGILDGLQLQWLLDPDLDTREALRRAVQALLPPPPSAD